MKCDVSLLMPAEVVPGAADSILDAYTDLVIQSQLSRLWLDFGSVADSSVVTGPTTQRAHIAALGLAPGVDQGRRSRIFENSNGRSRFDEISVAYRADALKASVQRSSATARSRLGRLAVVHRRNRMRPSRHILRGLGLRQTLLNGRPRRRVGAMLDVVDGSSLAPLDFVVARSVTPEFVARAASTGGFVPAGSPCELAVIVLCAVERPGRKPADLVSSDAGTLSRFDPELLSAVGIELDSSDDRTRVDVLRAAGLFVYGSPASMIEQLVPFVAAGVDEIVLDFGLVAAVDGDDSALSDAATVAEELRDLGVSTRRRGAPG